MISQDGCFACRFRVAVVAEVAKTMLRDVGIQGARVPFFFRFLHLTNVTKRVVSGTQIRYFDGSEFAIT